MRAKKWAGLILVLCVVTGFAFAEAEQAKPDKAAVQERIRQARTAAGQAQRGQSREQMYRERMARQAEAHRAEMQELLDIKKIAEEENATKTVEAIQKLIDKKNAEYQKGIEQVERARRQRAERLQERQKQAQPQADDNDDEGDDEDDDEGENDD